MFLLVGVRAVYHPLLLFFFYLSGDHRDLHVLTHSVPTRRSSDLVGVVLVVAVARSAALVSGSFSTVSSHRPVLPAPSNTGVTSRTSPYRATTYRSFLFPVSECPISTSGMSSAARSHSLNSRSSGNAATTSSSTGATASSAATGSASYPNSCARTFTRPARGPLFSDRFRDGPSSSTTRCWSAAVRWKETASLPVPISVSLTTFLSHTSMSTSARHEPSTDVGEIGRASCRERVCQYV